MTVKKKMEDVDHAFELALILVSIISGILAQYVPTEAEINLPPIIANIRRLSIVFIFPLILTVLVWIVIYFVDNESLKMHLRSYAWSSIIFSGILGIIEFYVICRPEASPEWVDYVFILGPALLGLFIPIIPFLLMWRILKRYKMGYGIAGFFSYEEKIGQLGKLVRYIPFMLSYFVFWLSLIWATLV